MTQITDTIRNSKRLRLIATALELLHCERGDSAVIPIPGTEPQRYVTIGTAETVAWLLEIAPTTSTVSATATSRELDIIRTMVFSVDQFAASGNPDGPAPWALNSPVVLAARSLCYEYGYETGNLIATTSSTVSAPEEMRNAILEEAAEKLDAMNDSAGDRAAYENRELKSRTNTSGGSDE